MSSSFQVHGASTHYFDPDAVEVMHTPDAAYAGMAGPGPWAVKYKGMTMHACPSENDAELYVVERGREIVQLADLLEDGYRVVEKRNPSSPAGYCVVRDRIERTISLHPSSADAEAFVTAVKNAGEAWRAKLAEPTSPCP